MNALQYPEFLRDFGFAAASRLQSRWTVVNELRLHSRSSDESNGSIPFVLIHGLVISSLYLIPLAECLSIKQPVHVLDLPGFGCSEHPAAVLSIPQLAEWVIAWMSESGIRRCHLVGQSLGCQVAAHVAAKAPELVVSLSLIGPTLDPQAFAVVIQTCRLFKDALHEPLRLWMNWAADFFRAGLRRAIGTTREMFRDHIEFQLPLIMAPTLVIRGGIDPTVPQAAAGFMTNLLTHRALMVIEGEPHCVHYTKPQLVSDAIEAHSRSAVTNS